MKTFTLKEVSKKINVSPGSLKQWEKDLDGVLDIPRTKQGARIYTDTEISQLEEIKQMYDDKLSKDAIRETLEKKMEPEMEPEVDSLFESFDSILPIVSESISSVPNEDVAIKNADQFFDAMDTYKQTFLNEVKDEIRSVLRKEVVEEVRKEISKGTFYTVKSISDSIYKSTANTKAELEELNENLEKANERTTESLKYLSNSITNVSIETSEEIFTLSKQLSESTEELAHYVDVTNTEISNLTEAIEKDREDLVKDLKQYRHEIRQRELAFQDMLSGFRDVAAAKEKKWWKFWAQS